jgi:glycosyltransferase involved in cell wall biosynthesis
MNILFANGRQSPPFFQGGDGVSLHTLLTWLHRCGHRIRCLGIINPHQREVSQEEIMHTLALYKATVTTTTQERFAYLLDQHYSVLLLRSDLFLPTLREELIRHQPDIVLTQLEASHMVIPLASAVGLPVIHFVHDTHPLNSRALAYSVQISKVLFNSSFTATAYRDVLQCPFEILYPPIEHARYYAEERFPVTLTMINPVAHKGASLVATLIRSLREYPFLLVPGWQPIEVETEGMSNVTVLSRQTPATMRQIYAQTKILLVPSQYEETFGRVAVEALINGIPVIASNVGGLPEAVGPGGIVIAAYAHLPSWRQAITDLLACPEHQVELGKQGQMHAQQFDIEHIGPQFHAILQNIVATHEK